MSLPPVPTPSRLWYKTEIPSDSPLSFTRARLGHPFSQHDLPPYPKTPQSRAHSHPEHALLVIIAYYGWLTEDVSCTVGVGTSKSGGLKLDKFSPPMRSSSSEEAPPTTSVLPSSSLPPLSPPSPPPPPVVRPVMDAEGSGVSGGDSGANASDLPCNI